LSVEAQAALFRQLMMTNAQTAGQQAPVQWPPAPGPRPPATGQAMVAADGRRIGRNRDAEAIVNTSDVYFAQLKLDSSIRNKARYQGDAEKADAVFADPAIQEIAMHTNPYLEETRRQEQALLETVAEEMLVFQNYETYESPPVKANDRGISYKEKLLEKKRRGSSQAASTQTGVVPKGTADSSVASTTAATAAATVGSEPVQQSTRAGESPAAHVDASPKPVTSPPLPQPVVDRQPQPVTQMYESVSDETSRRQDVRTLMGLLLKHRGGPGFGAGRLVGADTTRFDSLSEKVLATLRSEAVSNPVSFAPATALEPPSRPIVSAEKPVATAPSVGGGAIAQSVRVPVGDRINGMLACIEGAILMYRNAPLELQGSVLITLRAALMSAVGTCNEIVAGQQVEQMEAYRTALSDPRTRTSALTTNGSSQPSLVAMDGGSLISSGNSAASTSHIPIADRVISTLACIEGAIVMYRNSPLELQGSVLVTLRAALLSAIGTFTDILAPVQADQQQPFNGYGAATTTVPSATPRQFYDVVPETSENSDASSSVSFESNPGTSAVDENSAFLETVYNKLKNAAGGGKMGLRDDLDPADAESLADDISRMRALLVEELNGPAGTSSSSPSSAASKYQEMLAKARADKAAGL
jgi:hypothetical protein